MIVSLHIWLIFGSTKLCLVVHHHVKDIWLIRVWYFWGCSNGKMTFCKFEQWGMNTDFFFSSDKHVTRTIWSFFKSAWKTIWIQIMFSRRSCLLALCLSPLCVDKPQSRVKRPSEADWSQCQQSWDSFQPKAVQPVWNVCQAVERNSQRSYQNI